MIRAAVLILAGALALTGCESSPKRPRPSLGVAKHGVTRAQNDITDAKGTLAGIKTAAERADYKLMKALEYK